MYKIILAIVFLLGTYLHFYFFQTKDVLVNADSFAYLQMAYNFSNHSLSGFGTGWFGFLYSFFISIINVIVTYFDIQTGDSLLLSAKILNLILLNITGILLYFIGKIYLNQNYNLFLIILFFISPTLIDYNVSVLSENIYIPLFLALYLLFNKFIFSISGFSKVLSVKGVNVEFKDDSGLYWTMVGISFTLAMLYFTRGEAFIYLLSVFLILFILVIRKHISFLKFLKYNFIIILAFFLFISPYIYYLHTITGERGITNKGESNLRQAQMRGIQSMDDDGFERAVGELTPDKHHLIHGFAGGLSYDKPTSTGSLIQYIKSEPKEFATRFLENQKKLYSRTMPELVIGESLKPYNDKNSFVFESKIYLIFIFVPLFFLIYGIGLFIFSDDVNRSEKRNFMFIGFVTFLTASLFFTLFFVLPRYFIIFLPLMLVAICFGIEHVFSEYENNLSDNAETVRAIKYLLIVFSFSMIFGMGCLNYFTYSKFGVKEYELKRDAGLVIKSKYLDENQGNVSIMKESLKKSDNNQNTGTGLLVNGKVNLSSSKIDTSKLRIMERFPIFTYYIGSKERWITPYTSSLEDLVEYAKFNNIDYLVVDTMDFQKYRPNLVFLLDYNKKHKGLEFVRKFTFPGELLIIYKIKKS